MTLVQKNKIALAAALPALAVVWSALAQEERPARDRLGDPLPHGAISRLGTSRLRHPGAIAAAFGPDGKTLGSVGADGEVRIWEAATGKPLRRLAPAIAPNASGQVELAVFSRNGKTLATFERTFEADAVLVRDLEKGETLRELKVVATVSALVFSPGAERLATGDEQGAVRLIDVASGKELWKRNAHSGRVDSLAFSADGKTLASGPSGGEDKAIRLLEAESGRELAKLEGHEQGVQGLAFSSDGRRLASSSTDGSMRFWKTSTGKEVGVFRGPDARSILYSPDGRTLVAAHVSWPRGEGVRLWTVDTGAFREIGDRRGCVTAVALAPDGKTLATVGSLETVRLFDVATGDERGAPEGHDGVVTSVAFTQDGKTVVTASRDETLRFWEAGTGKELVRVPAGEDFLSLALAPDGKTLAAGGLFGSLLFLDPSTGKERAKLAVEDSVRTVAFSPDGALVAFGTGVGTIGALDLASRKEPKPVVVGDRTSSVAFSPDGKTLVGVGKEGIGVWRVPSFEPAAKLKDKIVGAVAFSPDGKTLVTAELGAVVLRDPVTLAERKKLAAEELGASTLAFAPDGKSLALGLSDGSVRICDPASGEPLRKLHGHSAAVVALAYSRDGEKLASASADTTVLVWSTPVRK